MPCLVSPYVELFGIEVGGSAEHDTAISIRENEGLSREQWGLRVNEYLHLVEKLLWPDLIIIRGGVSTEFYDFKPYIDVEAKVVPAESRNHAGSLVQPWPSILSKKSELLG